MKKPFLTLLYFLTIAPSISLFSVTPPPSFPALYRSSDIEKTTNRYAYNPSEIGLGSERAFQSGGGSGSGAGGIGAGSAGLSFIKYPRPKGMGTERAFQVGGAAGSGAEGVGAASAGLSFIKYPPPP